MNSDDTAATTDIDGFWRDLVTAALLGTDRRDPPDATGPLGDLVADAVRADGASRMLATVAATVAVRRAAVRPSAIVDGLQQPPVDERPSCTPAAVERWHHVVASWPALEDEWVLTCIEQGWRAAPELAPPMLRRHRSDQVRRARALVAIGPVATWLESHLPDLAGSASGRSLTPADIERLGELPELPIPPELSPLLEATGAEVGGAIAVGLEQGELAEAHRAVLVNVIARCVPGGLADVVDVLDAVDPRSSGRGLASLLADMATTRSRMLDELAG